MRTELRTCGSNVVPVPGWHQGRGKHGAADKDHRRALGKEESERHENQTWFEQLGQGGLAPQHAVGVTNCQPSTSPASLQFSWPELLVSICPAPPCLKAASLCRWRLGKQGSWWEATLADPANLERATFWLATKNTASLVRDWVVMHDDNHCF